jgi:hypothetical protein
MVQGPIKGCKGPAGPLARPFRAARADHHAIPATPFPPPPPLMTHDPQLTANLLAAWMLYLAPPAMEVTNRIGQPHLNLRSIQTGGLSLHEGVILHIISIPVPPPLARTASADAKQPA